jgi:hypothetical protein
VLALVLPLLLVLLMACLLHRPAEDRPPPCFMLLLLPAGPAAVDAVCASLPASAGGAAALMLPVRAKAGCWLL